MHALPIHHSVVRTTRYIGHQTKELQERNKLLKVAFKGRLKRIVVLSAPTSFWATWGAVRTVVDEETDKCIEFLDWPQAPERFRALFGESLAANMLREAEENRDPAQAATKKWQTFYGAEAKQLAGAKA